MPKHNHRSYGKNVEAFDGTALGEQPPRVSIPRGNPAPDRLPRAVERPSAVQTADGTEDLGSNPNTRGPLVKSQPRSGEKDVWPAGVDTYVEDEV